jgi:hypothetical protein
MSSAAYAVPVLQVGAPAAGGNCSTGPYAAYIGSLTNPTEDDTALTSGNTICVAGVYKPNVLNLGGQYDSGDNRSHFGYPAAIFDTHRAVLLVSIPNGSPANLLTISVNGSPFFAPFYTSTTLSGLLPNDHDLLNNHDPLKDDIADFLFFDIGDFDKNSNAAVPNFADASDPPASGEIKTLTLGNYSGYSWLHFDVLALETRGRGTGIVTTFAKNNPGSHDVTWKPDGTPPGGGQPVPEPGILWLLGSGLLAGGCGRRKGKNLLPTSGQLTPGGRV